MGGGAVLRFLEIADLVFYCCSRCNGRMRESNVLLRHKLT
jgi:hypothetical protein